MAVKKRGFVTGAFTEPVRQRLDSALMLLFQPGTNSLELVNNMYQQEYQRLTQAISEYNLDVINEYSKRVKTGGASQLA